MSSVLSRTLRTRFLCKKFVKCYQTQQFSSFSKKRKVALGAVAIIGSASIVTTVCLHQAVYASEDELHPPKYPFKHKNLLTTLDLASVRRGYQVYQQVCAACHSMKFMAYRHLVGVTHTEEEAKALAAEVMVQDGPDKDGKMFLRPGKLFDYFPRPYKNDEEARAANNGALPPDLSLIVLARHGGEDYIFSLLTGYHDPPAGVSIGEEQHYNAYFPGQAIGMAQALYNEIIEYEDGTPATQSQLAKDVTTFLAWSGDKYHDERKLYGLRAMLFLAIFIPMCWHMKKRMWAPIKTMKIAYKA